MRSVLLKNCITAAETWKHAFASIDSAVKWWKISKYSSYVYIFADVIVERPLYA